MKSLHRPLIAAGLVLAGFGCGRKDHYVVPQTGTRGTITGFQKVEYTPEQMEARDKAYGYAPPKPADARLAAIEDAWPKLTEEQRATLVKTVKEMTGE